MNIKDKNCVYFIGIGGIGMSALARYFKAHDYIVSGYDKTPSPITDGLSNIGISIHFEDDIAQIPTQVFNKENSLIVYTPAIPNTHLEYNHFLKEGFHIMKRAEVLGAITKQSFSFGVAGTHGKTTTSTLLGHILHETGVNATSFLGGIAENYNSNLILGGDEITVVEADEFDRSFLQLTPNIACITSMDADHLDIYGEAEALITSFKDFAALVSDQLFVKKGLPIPGITYGIEEEADYDAQNIRVNHGTYYFDVKTPTEIIKDVELHLSGRHNVLNTVVALAMAHSYGVNLQAIAEALKTFKGVQRRFSYKIKNDNCVLIDDYAHHPTEINAVADAIEEMFPKEKVLVVFQPHLFSRTRDFIDDFAQSLAKFDALILLEIYPAREAPIEGVTAQWLLDKVKMTDKQLVSKSALIKSIKKVKADVIVMLGAGDIGRLVDDVKMALLKK